MAYFGNIEDITEKNTFFRQVIFTGLHTQLVVMCLKPKEEIGDEVHNDVDQFFRIEEGQAKFVLNKTEEHLVNPGDGIIITAGTYHNVINESQTENLKLYTLYSPPNHPDGTIHKTKEEAEVYEHSH